MVKILKLNQVAKIQSGGTPKRTVKGYWKNGNIPWVKISDIKGKYIDYTEECITEEGLKNSSAKLFDKGTILYTIFATIGEVGILKIPATTNQAIVGIKADENIIIPEYLYYFLQSIKKKIVQSGRGVAQNNINISILNAIDVPVPTKAQQVLLIDILKRAEELIEKRQSQITTLDELSQSLFLDMFGDPISNENKFPKRPLSNFGEIITGNTPSRKEPEYYGDYIEWIKSDNINTPYHFLTTAEEYLSEKGLKKGRAVPENSILVTCIAGSKGCIGNAAIANRTVAFNQQINAIVPKGNPYFLYTQFLVGKKLIQQASTDGMKGLVSKGAFQKVEFIAPPLNLQAEFGEKFLAIQNQKQQLLESLDHLENLYNSLLQKAFKGELFQD